jgi:hypothetical protein
MPPLDDDGRGQVLHQLILAAAHVAAICLEKEALCIATGGEAGAVIEDAPVPAICGIPYRIAGLRLGIFPVVRGKIAIPVYGGAENDARIDIQEGSWISGMTRSVNSVNAVMTCWGSVPGIGR